MPNLDGWQTLRALKQLPETRAIPVVILSVVENRALAFRSGPSSISSSRSSGRPCSWRSPGRRVLATKGHVLVVDDDPDVRVLLEQELVAAGYRVRTASGGAQRWSCCGASARAR